MALKLLIDNERWAGAFFYLRTGKAMSARDTEIAIQFKAAPTRLSQGLMEGASAPNMLVLQLQPSEGVSLGFEVKRLGPDVRLTEVKMTFRYADWFETRQATGYETLLYDVMIGDQSLFNRAEDVEMGWRVVTPFLEAWASGLAKAHAYRAGTDGPEAAGDRIAGDGRRWRLVGGET